MSREMSCLYKTFYPCKTYGKDCNNCHIYYEMLKNLEKQNKNKKEIKMTNEEAIADIRDNIKPIVGGKSLDMAIETLENQKEGRWKKISPAGIYECTCCGQNVMTSDIECYKFCHGCGARMEEIKQ